MKPYIHQAGELFHKVQLQRVFEDGKTFPDCTPLLPLPEIIRRYEASKEKPGFNLCHFVHRYFQPPPECQHSFKSRHGGSVSRHIEDLWEVLSRSPQAEDTSLIPLKYPYVVPGGRFREVYYWDSYFTMLGLATSGRFDLVESMINNFAYLIDTIGHIPNANRAYYLGRSQPPFFSLMLEILSRDKGEGVFRQYLPQLEKEYRFWMKRDDISGEAAQKRTVRLPDGELLNRYWDEEDSPRPESYREDVELSAQSPQNPARLFRNLRAAAESGWDFSSRWLKDPHRLETIHTTDILPVDLNALLYHLEQTLARATSSGEAQEFTRRAESRKDALQKYFWKDGFYFDYNFVAEEHTPSYHLGACFPLYFTIATAHQARQVADILEKQFLQAGGLITTLESSGQQWDAPNGWAPLQWIAYKGLLNYGLDDLAAGIRKRWVHTNLSLFKECGKLTEKYNVMNNVTACGGEYPNQDGFGWTNGVLLALLNSP